MATLREIRSAMADKLTALGLDTNQIAEAKDSFKLPESDVTWAQVAWVQGAYIDALFYGATAVKGHRR